jgi:polysaccharide pyruvyl transferase WcaK-like protein
MPDAAFRTQIAKSPEERKKKVVFVLRESKNLTKSVLEELRKFEEWILNEKKYEVEFVAFHKSDENLHENTIVPETPEKALRLFAEAKFVVGMPLHSVIGAIKIQTPFLALEYAKKLEAFLKFAGLSELGIDFGKITSGEMKNRFESLEKNYSNVKENLKAFNKKAFEELKELEEMIKSHNVF